MHDTTLPAGQHDELEAPASSSECLFRLSYNIHQLVKIATQRPDLLDLIAEDLAEAYTLIVPAAEHVQTVVEAEADAAA